jgi:hypothetical protein
MRVFLLIEEIESGYYADMETYQILGAFQSEAGAKAAHLDWQKGHQGDSDENHPFETKDSEIEMSHPFWCGVCECGVEIKELELEA